MIEFEKIIGAFFRQEDDVNMIYDRSLIGVGDINLG